MQDSSQDLILAIVVIAMASLHLFYAFGRGKVLMGASWIRREESPISFWLTVLVTVLLLAGGLYVAIFGLPEGPGQ